MAETIFEDFPACYRDGGCPFTDEQLDSFSDDELKEIAIEHGYRASRIDCYYNKNVTIRQIKKCYSISAKMIIDDINVRSKKAVDDFVNSSPFMQMLISSEKAAERGKGE